MGRGGRTPNFSILNREGAKDAKVVIGDNVFLGVLRVLSAAGG
jgi:hypothetical protein